MVVSVLGRGLGTIACAMVIKSRNGCESLARSQVHCWQVIQAGITVITKHLRGRLSVGMRNDRLRDGDSAQLAVARDQ
jgi:hypothetical protein